MGSLEVLIIGCKKIVSKEERTRLLSIGYEVIKIANSWPDAIMFIKDRIPDLILADASMSIEKNEIEEIRQMLSNNDIPIVYFIFDKGSKKIKIITQEFDYLINPMEESELVTAIEMTLLRNNIQKRLRENEKWVGLAIESFYIPVIIVDKNLKVRFMNTFSKELLVYKDNDATGKDINKIFSAFKAESTDAINKSIRGALSQGVVSKYQETFFEYMENTLRIPVIYTILPVKSSNGDIEGANIIIRNNEKHDAQGEINEAFSNFIETISKMFEFKDSYTVGHQRRVAELAKLVGQKLNLSKQDIDDLYFGGLLHDIGKIGIPMDILTKTSKLSEAEFELVKQHPRIGFEILKDLKLSQDIIQVVQSHHEKLDGTGYPYGIPGSLLSKKVRIISICDVVEAMSSFRPYRAARPKKEVVKELLSGRGVKYDEEIVDIIIALIITGEFNPWKS